MLLLNNLSFHLLGKKKNFLSKSAGKTKPVSIQIAHEIPSLTKNMH
jgi:hypothetical protein